MTAPQNSNGQAIPPGQAPDDPATVADLLPTFLDHLADAAQGDPPQGWADWPETRSIAGEAR